jgi:hypothetical protein
MGGSLGVLLVRDDNGCADGIVAGARRKGKLRRGRCLRRSPGV